jgi:hypothetical protein
MLTRHESSNVTVLVNVQHHHAAPSPLARVSGVVALEAFTLLGRLSFVAIATVFAVAHGVSSALGALSPFLLEVSRASFALATGHRSSTSLTYREAHHGED